VLVACLVLALPAAAASTPTVRVGFGSPHEAYRLVLARP